MGKGEHRQRRSRGAARWGVSIPTCVLLPTQLRRRYVGRPEHRLLAAVLADTVASLRRPADDPERALAWRWIHGNGTEERGFSFEIAATISGSMPWRSGGRWRRECRTCLVQRRVMRGITSRAGPGALPRAAGRRARGLPPGQGHRWIADLDVERLFKAIEQMDADDFVTFLADDVRFRFGSSHTFFGTRHLAVPPGGFRELGLRRRRGLRDGGPLLSRVGVSPGAYGALRAPRSSRSSLRRWPSPRRQSRSRSSPSAKSPPPSRRRC